ncbi:dihydrolipoyl dehydrogenase, partial [bacterium]|nr:dihydrolipoyl dehydrogenase [bacterium]
MVMGSLNQEVETVVIGSGPGGYVAALRLADLGQDVMLIEERDRPGGVCLLEGCIPSKSLINAVELSEAAREAERLGLTFSDLKLDHRKLREWTDGVVATLSDGIRALLNKRGVELVHGHARFQDAHSLMIEGGGTVSFANCIIATGSSLNRLPEGIDSSVWSSADALELKEVPGTLLVVGGGYIGLELGLVYAGLGSEVSVVEFLSRLLMGADHDLVDVMVKQVEKRTHELMLDSRVVSIKPSGGGFDVQIEHEGQTLEKRYDQVLVAIGRRPNTEDLGLEHTRVVVDDKGVIETDGECRTAEPHIYAVGDVAAGPMLAHKASREGKIAAEAIAGHKVEFDNRAIPAVVFTDPEISWCGLTERRAADLGTEINVGRFPLSALGRARAIGHTEGFVKIISEPGTDLILGVGIVGTHASELISEGALAIEMGATLADLTDTIVVVVRYFGGVKLGTGGLARAYGGG